MAARPGGRLQVDLRRDMDLSVRLNLLAANGKVAFGKQEPMASETGTTVDGEARIAAALARCERAAEALAARARRHRHLEREAEAVLAEIDSLLASSRETALG
jgi:hypothetical protein